MKTNKKGFIEALVTIWIIYVIALVWIIIYDYFKWDKYDAKLNNYIILCEAKWWYIFDMYGSHLFCMKWEFIPIGWYSDIKTLDRLK